MELWLSAVVGAVVIAVCYIIVNWATSQRRRIEAAFPNMPGPKPLPVIGHLVDFLRRKGELHLQFDEYCKEYGRVFAFWFIKFPSLVVTDPEMIRQILVKDFHIFHDRPMFTALPKPLGSMLTALSGNRWRHVRNTLSPTFSGHKMKLMLPLINEACAVLEKKLETTADSGESVKISTYVEQLSLDVIMVSAFGVKSQCQTNENDPLLAQTRTVLGQNFLQILAFFLVAMLPFGDKLMESDVFVKVFFKAFFGFEETAQRVIDVKRQGGVLQKKDMLDLMLTAENPDSHEKKLTDDEIVANCMVFLLAGYETTNGTLGLTCYYLATNPDIQERLQREVDQSWTDELEQLTYESVQEMTYMDMVISETLRVCPPAIILSRIAVEDCVVKEIKIPKGTAILVPSYSLHHDPEFWPDPEKYDPMRFSPESKKSRDPYTYIPFGHGPHNCIGMRFALMEMKLVLMHILKRFTLEVAPETQIPPKIGRKGTLKCVDGVTLKVSRRK